MDLIDEQWERIKRHIPEHKPRGRPRRDDREVKRGILWILRTGARWQDLPKRYPSYQTCHRRFQEWTELEVIQKILEQIAQDLYEQGDLDLSECFIDGSFVAAKKGDLKLAKQRKGKALRLWPLQMRLVFQSPLTLAVLTLTKSPLLKAPSLQNMFQLALVDLLETEPMTATNLMKRLPFKALT